ncbi:hypothetical protein QR685DRAFT_519579 [Neurospora intermedia]|uniref:Secreted protein n=1 Tax=Neurospora intermedia TaxID=5142 RepID=A0ABR3DG19_NEUIN
MARVVLIYAVTTLQKCVSELVIFFFSSPWEHGSAFSSVNPDHRNSLTLSNDPAPGLICSRSLPNGFTPPH